MEKTKTGEMLAAKVVSETTHLHNWVNNDDDIGKSSEALEAYHAVLGEQVDTQAERQK